MKEPDEDQVEEKAVINLEDGTREVPDLVQWEHLRQVRDAILPEDELEEQGITTEFCDYHQQAVPKEIGRSLPNKLFQCVFCVSQRKGEELEEEWSEEEAAEFYWKMHVMTVSVLQKMGAIELETEEPYSDLLLPGRDF